MLLRDTPHEIIGKQVNCDFLFWMDIGVILDSDNLTIIEKVEVVNKRVFGMCPMDMDEAGGWYSAVLNFYMCGAEDRGLTPPAERLLDWEKDSNTIWADFYRVYKINLDSLPDYNKDHENGLHWWQFKALFDSLPADTRIKTNMTTRDDDLSDIKDAKYRQQREEQKRAVALEWQAEEYDF